MEPIETYNVDLGVYGEQVLEEKILEFDVYCPFIVYIDPDPAIMNFSSEQCKLRIQNNNKCWKKCGVGKKIKKEMDDNG